METKYKTFLILEFVLMVLALLFSAGGCERKLGNLPEKAMPTESAEQTQSLHEAPPAGAEAEELGVIIERNVPVPMRDGVILRADVYRPDRGGPYPVLVMRTPYNKVRFSRQCHRLAKAGYIVVCQDVRGLYSSEGKYESYWRFKTHDGEDGYDTVQWAAKLPGSTGKVGTFGGSYMALLQWRLAALHPPSLVAMSAHNVMARFEHEQGTLRPSFRFMVLHAPEMRRRANRPGVHTVWEAQKLLAAGESEKWRNWLPWLELPREFFEDETEAVHYWLRNPHKDPWRLDECCKETTVPNLDILGWYDHCLGDVLLFRTMVKEAKTEIARKGSRVIIGPWRHGSAGRRFGNIDFGPDAELDIAALQIRWFDY